MAKNVIEKIEKGCAKVFERKRIMEYISCHASKDTFFW
jgi:hypothetical protein